MTEASALHKDLNYYLNLPYPVQLTHQREDGDEYWLAEILDLPGCMSDGLTPDEAIQNLEDAKHLWIETQIEDGLEVPEPTRADDYSGKFLVRMPKTLHQRLAEQAKREGTSLNQHVIVLLSDGSSATEQFQQVGKSVAQLQSKVDILTKAVFAMQAHQMPQPNPNMDRNRLVLDSAAVAASRGDVMVARAFAGSINVDPSPTGIIGMSGVALMAANQDPQIAGDHAWFTDSDRAERTANISPISPHILRAIFGSPTREQVSQGADLLTEARGLGRSV